LRVGSFWNCRYLNIILRQRVLDRNANDLKMKPEPIAAG
jgi:hypothetical protein